YALADKRRHVGKWILRDYIGNLLDVWEPLTARVEWQSSRQRNRCRNQFIFVCVEAVVQINKREFGRFVQQCIVLRRQEEENWRKPLQPQGWLFHETPSHKYVYIDGKIEQAFLQLARDNKVRLREDARRNGRIRYQCQVAN